MEISTISQNEDLLEYKIVHLFPSSRSFYMQCMCMLIEWMLTIDRFGFFDPMDPVDGFKEVANYRQSQHDDTSNGIISESSHSKRHFGI